MDHFKTMQEITAKAFTHPVVAYCDYIAHLILKALNTRDDEGLLKSVGKINFDVSPEGHYISTKKTIEVTDRNGKTYRVTVEEV